MRIAIAGFQHETNTFAPSKADYAAFEAGELDELEALLAHDVMFTGDGGGKAPTPALPVRGRALVARGLGVVITSLAGVPGFHIRPSEINGGPGGLFLDGQERLFAVWALEIGDGQIQGIRSVVNPDKLAHLGATVNLGSLLGHQPPSAQP
jgi:hypothetical protein